MAVERGPDVRLGTHRVGSRFAVERAVGSPRPAPVLRKENEGRA
jgi:hypothetical protein